MPAPPKEELPKGEEKSKVVVKSPDPHADETVVELDDWLIDFANLFRDQLGIDPDKCAARSNAYAHMFALLSIAQAVAGVLVGRSSNPVCECFRIAQTTGRRRC